MSTFLRLSPAYGALHLGLVQIHLFADRLSAVYNNCSGNRPVSPPSDVAPFC